MNSTPLPPNINRFRTSLPRVAIVGRANVGKSTLFNRLVGKRKSIVQEESGTTRDRIHALVSWHRHRFQIFDTGGFQPSSDAEFGREINQQIQHAIAEADLVLLVCDGKSGVQPQDEMLIERLRHLTARVILVINKLDEPESPQYGDEFYRLGIRRMVKISAVHGLGIDGLLDAICQSLPESGEDLFTETPQFSLCIVGEPNVGKSTYFNALLQEERAIVSEIPGTTRDTIDETITYKDVRMTLVDTAGIRRRKAVTKSSDFFGAHRTKAAIRQSQLVFFMFDAAKGITHNSKQIFRLIDDEQKCCVLIANKWDSVKGFEQGKYAKELVRYFPQAANYPIAFISAQTQRNILRPLDLAIDVYRNYRANIKTSALNRFLERLKKSELVKGNARLKYLVQVKSEPPHFLLMARHIQLLNREMTRFIVREMRSEYNLSGTPIHLILREADQ